MSSLSKPTIIPDEDLTAANTRGDSALSHLGRKLLLSQLSHIQDGELRIQCGEQHWRYGQRTERCPLIATIYVDHPQFFADAAFGGTTGAGEAYINGHWRCDDLTALVRIMVVNRHVMEQLEGGLAAFSNWARRTLHCSSRACLRCCACSRAEAAQPPPPLPRCCSCFPRRCS